MHPVEHLFYFATILYHLVIPSNPVIALYQLHYAGFGAVPGHVGFDKIELTKSTAIDSHAYIHYLHHKYFECNYADGDHQKQNSQRLEAWRTLAQSSIALEACLFPLL